MHRKIFLAIGMGKGFLDEKPKAKELHAKKKIAKTRHMNLNHSAKQINRGTKELPVLQKYL